MTDQQKNAELIIFSRNSTSELQNEHWISTAFPEAFNKPRADEELYNLAERLALLPTVYFMKIYNEIGVGLGDSDSDTFDSNWARMSNCIINERPLCLHAVDHILAHGKLEKLHPADIDKLFDNQDQS